MAPPLWQTSHTNTTPHTTSTQVNKHTNTTQTPHSKLKTQSSASCKINKTARTRAGGGTKNKTWDEQKK